MTEPQFKKIAIAGVGLLGGSFGMAVRERKLCQEVIGIGRTQAPLEEARRQEAIDRGTLNMTEGIADADLIILCTPVRHILSVLPEVVAAAKPGAIITDVGSTKANIVRDGETLAAKAKCHFVGCHPMAGSEKSGVRNARPNLYEETTCFVTKTPLTSMTAFVQVCALWREMGARIVVSRPDRHDRLVASISHLPHMMAVALVRAMDQFNEDKNLIKGIIGNGFRDTTRVAGGDSRMWEDICTDNREEILRARDVLETSIQELMDACGSDSCDKLRHILEEAAEYREFLDHK